MKTLYVIVALFMIASLIAAWYMVDSLFDPSFGNLGKGILLGIVFLALANFLTDRLR